MLDAIETTTCRAENKFLSYLAYANGMTHCGYNHPSHSMEDILRPGYFDPLIRQLAPGDWIFVSASDGPLILWVRGNSIGCTVERVR